MDPEAVPLLLLSTEIRLLPFLLISRNTGNDWLSSCNSVIEKAFTMRMQSAGFRVSLFLQSRAGGIKV